MSDREPEGTAPASAAPGPEEYDPYYAGYVQRVAGKNVLGVLRAQRMSTLNLLAAITEQQALFRYAPGKWSLKEVVGHVIDTERVFAYRALAFTRRDRTAQPGFDQDAWAAAGGFDGRPLTGLAAEYDAVRGATLALLEGFDRSDWTASGIANGVRFSVRAIAAILAGHEAHHLAILRERYLVEGIER